MLFSLVFIKINTQTAVHQLLSSSVQTAAEILCSSLLFCCSDKTLAKSNLERKGLFLLAAMLSHEGKAGQELNKGSWRYESKRRPQGNMDSSLFLWFAQLTFLYNSEQPAQGQDCEPMVDRALAQQFLIKKCHIDLPRG